MARAFNKDFRRSITHSWGRFIAIAAIVALGAGFYAGLRMTAPDMDNAADRYYDGTDLMDIRVVSTMGITDGDLDALRDLPGISAVMGAYETDVLALVEDEQYAIRIHSLPEAAPDATVIDARTIESADEDYLNRLSLAEGRWPEKKGECVISYDRVMNVPVAIGDKVRISEGTTDLADVLSVLDYTIVGFVHAPYYAASSNLGTTSLGSGTVQQFMYVTPDNFAADYPLTEAFCVVEGAKELDSNTDAYEQRIDEVMKEIEDLAPAREQARWDQLRGDAQKELDDARKDFEDEKASAEAELADAKALLDETPGKLADSERQIDEGQADYGNGVAELASQRESVAAQLAQAQRQIADSERELANNRRQLEDAAAALSAAWSQAGLTPDGAQAAITRLQDGIAQAREGRDQAQAGLDQVQAGIAQIQEGIDQVDQGLSQVEAAIAEVRQALEADPQNPVLLQQLAAAQAQQQTLLTQREDLEAQRAPLADQEAQLQQTISDLDGQMSTLQTQLDGIHQLQSRQATYDQQKAAFDAALPEAQARLQAARDEVASSRSAADARFAEAEQQLAEAAAILDDYRSQLAQGRADYEQGQRDYDQARQEADDKYAEAEEELSQAQQDIDALERPEWLVMDRTKNTGVVMFSSDAERIDHIAQLFPFIFFLVAALVALTTMTRMVEEERVLIGTYKALGYSRGRIASKYLLYGLLASGIGAVVGIAVLSQVLPATIMYAYTIIYYVPHGTLPLDWPIAITAAVLGIGVTLIATWAAAYATLRESPAELMLPRAPKAGRRILLERIRPLWRRLSFLWKVTARNLFRYKKRFIMTLIGIAGCTALLLTGLGLQNAIDDIIDKQYGELVNYNVMVTVEDDIDAARQKELDELIADERYLGEHTGAHNRSVIAEGADGKDLTATLVTPEVPEDFQKLWVFRERLGHAPLTLEDDGVIISEKLSYGLGIGVGDNIRVAVPDEMGNATDEVYELPVSGIMENYIANYVFVGPVRYEETFGEEPSFTTTYGTIGSDTALRADFSEEARAIDGVRTVAFTDETIDTYRTMLSSVNLVVIVLVVAAAALAFIVLYNLTNINITERQREIATLKVLGFTPREVALYIFREIILLAIIGCAIGLVLGIFLEGFVVSTAEVEQVMFGREIHALSFLWAFLLTMVFTLVVMVFMWRKLTHVDMVESLKSNE